MGADLRLLVRLCADAAAGATSQATAEAAGEVRDWSTFPALIRRHRVAGLVHRALSRGDVPAPAAVQAAAAEMENQAARRNMALAAETIRLQGLFDEAGVRVVFLKGAPLSQRAYGDALIKQGKDVDFLTSEDDLPRAVALLGRLGYRLTSPRASMTDAQWRRVMPHAMEAAMTHSVSGIQLEPHWRLTVNPRLLDAGELRERAGDGWDTLLGRPIRTLHPDDQYAYLCAHGAGCAWFRLKWLADLHALIRRESPDGLARLDRHASRLGVSGASALAVWLCDRMFDMPAPTAMLRRVEGSRPLSLLAAHCLGVLARPEGATPWSNFKACVLLAAAEGVLASELNAWSISAEDVLDWPLPRPLRFLHRGVRVPAYAWRRLIRPALTGREA